MSKKSGGDAGKTTQFRLQVGAGNATPAPPVGPAFGQRGIRAIDFCKQFNAITESLQPGVPVPCVITVKPDRTFTFVTKSPPSSYLLKKAAGIEKGCSKAGKEVAGNPVSLKHVYEMAKIKCADKKLAEHGLERVARMIIGSARSMGIRIIP